MSTVVGGTTAKGTTFWSRRTAVYEFLMEDVAAGLHDPKLVTRLRESVDANGLDLDDLSLVDLAQLLTAANDVAESYRSKTAEQKSSEPDYAYLNQAASELAVLVSAVLDWRRSRDDR